eukprot:Gregarina_sp_Poly_1__7125@NODE_38_length_18185_cov_164_455735_g33_i0_p5_GENE_NODE_38_length_18185_cov_164_455735_g33_i0NODE_38_length_18185_cov_164_455735_g33_i0_p5_ORF_typecomplete_len292_score16_41TPT/PF03151_16/7_9e37UAA/PF08449_11/4_2e13EamA/PF00892_20/0_00075EamA/PF00892_20/9_5e08CRTlike/PF08627_10/4_7e06CRTlike/PF08627_10/0_0045PUNUT/PF16913_5/1_2e06SLC35F/PF06027_12/4_7e07Nuc_sug_transp/PF04142_15/0_021Nuc_sug_transp/PF04142_15/0_018Herpes_ORF11/PF04797_13/0_051Mg_trans_NIPA/PF05653_14/5_
MVTNKPVAFGIYTVSSAVFVLCNRGVLLSNRRPIAVTCYQQAVVLLCYILYQLLVKRAFPFSARLFRHALPCSGFFLSMVALNNVCLSFTPVTGYIIARASTIIFNLLLACCLLHRNSCSQEWIACVLVASAVFFGGKGSSSTLEMVGLVTGILASLSQASFSCFISRVFAKNPTIKAYELLGHYTAITVFVLFTVLFLGVETTDPPLSAQGILFIGLLNAVVASSALISLSLSNPVTVNLLGYLKSTVQALLGVVIFHDQITLLKLVGLFLTIGGSLLYSLARNKQKNFR